MIASLVASPSAADPPPPLHDTGKRCCQEVYQPTSYAWTRERTREMRMLKTVFTPQQLTTFAQVMVASASTPLAVVDRDLRILAANRPFQDVAGEEAVGLPLLALAGGRWDTPEARRALEAVLGGPGSFDDISVSGPDGQPLFLSAQPIDTTDSDPNLILVSLDEKPLDDRTADRIDERKIAHEVVDTVREPMLVLDYKHQIKWANQAFYRSFRLGSSDVEGRFLPAVGEGAWDIPQLRTLLDTVLKKGGRLDNFQVAHEFGAIGRREMLLNAARIDHLRLILLAFEDITERQEHQRRQETLMAEMAHRIKNVLAVAQSLALQTQADSVEAFRSAYTGRLKALAVAQGVLLEAQWQGADLKDLVKHIVNPYDAAEVRVRTQGPRVALLPWQVTAFALILNELATNAAKYGALSADSGQVEVAWDVASGRLDFAWREEGGPPVRAAAKTGFGTKLIERVVSAQLDGEVELTFESGGLRCDIQVPSAGPNPSV